MLQASVCVLLAVHGTRGATSSLNVVATTCTARGVCHAELNGRQKLFTRPPHKSDTRAKLIKPRISIAETYLRKDLVPTHDVLVHVAVIIGGNSWSNTL